MRVTRVATWALIVIGCLAAILAGLAMARGGIGWDAPVDAQAVSQISAIPVGATLQQAYDAVFWTSEFYGVFVSQLAQGAHTLITGSSAPLEASDLATYRWLGGVTIVLAVAGAASLGFAVSRALRSTLAGSFAWALTMTTPLYFGASHVNFKDVPVAAGLSMVSAGLVLSRTCRHTWARWASGVGLISVGACVALGSRVGAWPLLLAIIAASILAFLMVDLRGHRLRNLVPTVVSAAASVCVVLAFLWATNPFGRMALFQWLYDSFIVMRAYPMDLVIRVGGADYPTSDLPWWYVPGWLLAQLPVLTTIALAWAAAAAVASLARARWSVPRGSLVDITPFAIQGVVLPVGIVLSGAVLYDGLRHVLFMIPALAALAAIGVAALEKGQFRGGRHLKAAAAVVGVVVVGMSAFASVRWMPYSYAFINPIAGHDHSQRAWELDYWGVSAMEGVRRLEEAGLTPVAVDPTASTSDIVGAIWPDQAKEQAPDGYGLYVFKRFDASIGACEPLFTIERDGQVLGEGARCTKWTR